MSATQGYRRMLVSLDLVEMAIRNGARCSVPKDVPKDLRVVAVAMPAPRTLDLLVASESFPEHLEPGQSDVITPSYRRVDCGHRRMETIEAAARELRERYAISLQLRGSAVIRPLARITPQEMLALLDDIVRLASGLVEDGPPNGAGAGG